MKEQPTREARLEAMAGPSETTESALLRRHQELVRNSKRPWPKPKRDPLATARGWFRGFSDGTNSAPMPIHVHTHESPSCRSFHLLPHTGDVVSMLHEWCCSVEQHASNTGSSMTPPAHEPLQHPASDDDPSAARSRTAPSQSQQQQLEDHGAPTAHPCPAFVAQDVGTGTLCGRPSSLRPGGEDAQGRQRVQLDAQLRQRGLLTRSWEILKEVVHYLFCGPSGDRVQEPDATLLYPYDCYDIEAAQYIMQGQAVPPAAELRRRNLNPSSVNSVVAQAQEKQRRQAVNDWIKQVGDAIAVPQALTRLAYFAEITLWTTLLLHRPLCPTSLAPTREVAVMAVEMFLGFLAVSYTHFCIVSHHSVTTTALHISRRSNCQMALMFALITCGWMLCYTLNISPSVYRNWMWAITVPFVVVNLRNTYVYGCKGLVTEARVFIFKHLVS